MAGEYNKTDATLASISWKILFLHVTRLVCGLPRHEIEFIIDVITEKNVFLCEFSADTIKCNIIQCKHMKNNKNKRFLGKNH